MKPEREDLTITEAQLETLTGFDVSEVFIGSILGGVYRLSVFHNPQKLLAFCLTEIFVSALVFLFTLPLGLFFTRNSANNINELPGIIQFCSITLGITLIVILGWHLYMWSKFKHLITLMHLLDEVDRYNEVVQAVALIDRLEAVVKSPVNLNNRKEVMEALRVTRDSLVSGLITEKLLRESRGLLASRYDLLANIESNLVSLRILEVNNQANEYRELLDSALQIGLSVHKEVQKFSRFPPH
jgi:hypothetical protein